MSTYTVSPLRQRMIEDMNARKLGAGTQRGHIHSKIPQVMSPDETRRVLAVATSLKARAALSLCYGCGLRAGEVVRLKVKHIDRAQKPTRARRTRRRHNSPRPCPAQHWRSRIFSATSDRRGVVPMSVTSAATR